MGLAASQARLLTITARKADCEFQSMRYSHQKIALSRNMTDISNEYQNSLNQTKLVYDFYGNNDKSLALSYGLMMTPSELNGHMPILTTDSAGKIVLNTQFAAAVRAAGIPQEGLGCLPSSTVRNRFLQELASTGLITPEAATAYQGITYAQEMGLGTTDLVTTTIQQMNLTELLDYYSSKSDQELFLYTNAGMKEANEIPSYADVWFVSDTNTGDNVSDKTLISLAEIISGDYQILCGTNERRNAGKRQEVARGIGQLDIWEWMFGELENMLSISGNPEVSGALAYAKAMCSSLISYDDGVAKYVNEKFKTGDIRDALNAESGKFDDGWWGGAFGENCRIPTADYIGICEARNKNWWGWGSGNLEDGISISVSNIAKAFLTYFAQYMEGGERLSDYKVSDTVGNRTIYEAQGTHFIDDDFYFDIPVDQGINTNQALNSAFYDAMFNQICLKGWVENANIDDNNYLQEMLQSGVLFISTCNDDGNYYQGNYSTNSFIKEVADEEAIARAEAKYNTEKQKINSKEEVLDMKMKNLDTEISSLTTEYDTIKSVISKNIEKSFKRYDA